MYPNDPIDRIDVERLIELRNACDVLAESEELSTWTEHGNLHHLQMDLEEFANELCAHNLGKSYTDDWGELTANCLVCGKEINLLED